MMKATDMRTTRRNDAQTPPSSIGAVARGLRILGVAALVAIGLQVAAMPTASAAKADGGCVTRAELDKVDDGATRAEVRKVVGARGRLVTNSPFGDGDVWRTYAYRQCGRTWAQSKVSITFSLEPRPVGDPAAADSMPAGELQNYYPVVYDGPFLVRKTAAVWR